MASAIESILLVAGEPVAIGALARCLGTDEREIEEALDHAMKDLAGSGIRIQSHDGNAQLVTAPENADIVRTFLMLPLQPRISRPSLETLAIIAYRQPVTKTDIEEVRGVSVDRVIANLVARGLIEERGRRDSPGRPIEYGTTAGFLELFGLTALDELLPVASTDNPDQESATILGMDNRGYDAGDDEQAPVEEPPHGG